MMKRSTKTLAGVLGVGALGLGVLWLSTSPAEEMRGTPATSSAASAAEARSTETLATVTLHVEGMTCAGCVLGTRTVLERLEGVQKAEVSYEESRAMVTYDPALVDVERMVQAVAELGYEARVLEGGS